LAHLRLVPLQTKAYGAIIMQTMPEKWTDERLDDLNAKVDRGFERVDVEIADLGTEMNARFDKVDDRFDQVNARIDQRFDALNERFDRLYRAMLGFGGALLIAFVASNLAS
jgi:tetrahydromethanopterin S-methyltransferase subunit G